MDAFLSYHHEDRHVAGKVCEVLATLGIDGFMAHEDIAVSHEWHDAILEALANADIFVALLSKKYLKSCYCLQESGVAVFRKTELTIVPLSIDGTIPPGFMNRVQAKSIDPDDVRETDVLAGVAKHDLAFVVEQLAAQIASSGSYETAEFNFARLAPFLRGLDPKLATKVLSASDGNNQVWYARKNRPILRGMLKTYAHSVPDGIIESLTDKLDRIR